MISRFKFLIENVNYRGYKKFNKALQARIFQKMTSRMFKEEPTRSTKILEGWPLTAYNNEGSSRRTVMLNKIYMEEIAQILHVGDNSTELSDLGIKMTKVKISNACNYLHIYWTLQKRNILYDDIVNLLEKTTSEVQQKLIASHRGRVPIVKFVRDIKLEQEESLEPLFNVADYGKNYLPNHPKKLIRAPMGEHLEDIPKMSQSVLGLDHGKIKEKIDQEIIRHKTINLDVNPPKINIKNPPKMIVFNKDVYTKFYKRKMQIDRKMLKTKFRDPHKLSDIIYDEENELEYYWKCVTNDFFNEEEDVEEVEEDHSEDDFSDLDDYEELNDKTDEMNKKESIK